FRYILLFVGLPILSHVRPFARILQGLILEDEYVLDIVTLDQPFVEWSVMLFQYHELDNTVDQFAHIIIVNNHIFLSLLQLWNEGFYSLFFDRLKLPEINLQSYQ